MNCVYYDPEAILFNLFGGFIHNLSKLSTEVETVDQQYLFDFFLSWTGKLFKIFKQTKKNDLTSVIELLNVDNSNDQTKYFPIKLNNKLFANFPNANLYFFLSDDYIKATKKDDDLYLNNSCGCKVIKPNSFFDNFCASKQIKQYQNTILFDSVKLPNLFYNNGLIKAASANSTSLAIEINKKYPENFDFLIFIFKLFDILSAEECFSSYLQFINNSESDYYLNEKILNNLRFIDCQISQKLFAHVIYFASHKYYYSKKLSVKWELVFGVKPKENFYMTMEYI